jgi:hypothetical protein
MPGALLSPGTYASFPLWEITGSWGKAGLACFLSALALGGADVRLSAAESLAGQVWGLCRAALVVCLFLPWSPADHVFEDSLLVPAADFCLFWLKTALFFLAASPLPGRAGIVSRPLLCLAGAAGMYADLVFGAPPPLPLFP